MSSNVTDLKHSGARHAHGAQDNRHDHVHAGKSHGHDHSGHGHDHRAHDHDGHDDHDHGSGLWAKLKHTFVPHSHDAQAIIQQSAEEARGMGIRTAWIGLAGMMVTAVLQVFIVAISGSMALLADTVHNFGHAVTTIPLVIAFKIGARKPNPRFPYGYRRAEDIVGIFIALIIFVTAAYIVYESIDALVNPRDLSNLAWVFAAGVVGFVGNELVAMYRIRGGKRIGSAALIAEGQHARADGFTSLAVVLGAILAWLGFPQADPIIGIFIALVIFGIMVSSLKTILHRLMDGVDKGLVDQITAAVSSVEGVRTVTAAKARWSGHRLLVDTIVEVDSDLPVGESIATVEAIKATVKRKVANVEDTLVEISDVPRTKTVSPSLT